MNENVPSAPASASSFYIILFIIYLIYLRGKGAGQIMVPVFVVCIAPFAPVNRRLLTTMLSNKKMNLLFLPKCQTVLVVSRFHDCSASLQLRHVLLAALEPLFWKVEQRYYVEPQRNDAPDLEQRPTMQGMMLRQVPVLANKFVFSDHHLGKMDNSLHPCRR